ncbi:MAG: DNA-directed RNA polymerase subunit B [Candidatus Nanoarchaeia archaeon]|nr:DNA-directed RNA polymerase subunit B [Candidatus Nanoarchaeia archaeon]
MTEVCFNGVIVGTVKNAEEFSNNLKKLRRNNQLTNKLNVHYDKKADSLQVLTEAGRARRPLIIVENGKSKLTDELIEKLKSRALKWNDLVKLGVIEYLDAEEEEDSYIALNEKDLNEKHTHLEIINAGILGSQAGLAPFSNHNSTGRVMLAAKMITQGLGIYTTNFNLRIDSDVSIMHYPQKPVVDTMIYKNVKYDSHPIGQNVVIAIMTNEGYNMDDAIVLNKDSVGLGLFRSTFFKPYICEELRYSGEKDEITRLPDPDKGVSRLRGMEEDYAKLEDDGIIYPEAKIHPNSVLVGKVSPPRFLMGTEEFRMEMREKNDSSIACEREDGKVDSVILTETEDGNKFVNIRIRQARIPEIGDKFATRHGQKGVIGMLVPEKDMPFTSTGVYPDIIFSPHSIPSRMTVGQLIEIIGGKVGALGGRNVDGTIFSSESEKDLRTQLHELGFRENGSETLYDGKTGRMLNVRIFIGNVYYMRLKYMVSNKYHMRTRGPVQLLTRQPTEGRSKDGGLRLGEMEKDVLVAHGAALLLKERFDSDKEIMPVCSKCGMISYINYYRNKGVCSICGEDAPVTFIEMSYAFKLLLDELKSLCIYPKLNIKYKD